MDNDSNSKTEGGRIDTKQLNSHLWDYLGEFHGLKNKRDLFKCLAPDHPDKHPSMGYDPKREIVHCFACGKTYTLIDLVMQDRGLSLGDAIRWLSEKYENVQMPKGANVQPSRAYLRAPVKRCQETTLESLGDDEAIKYLTDKRGFRHAQSVARSFRVKSDPTRLYLPHFAVVEGRYQVSELKYRYFNPTDKSARYMHFKGDSATIYDNFMLLSMKREGQSLILVVEGEIDALSVYDLKQDEPGLDPLQCVALSSIANLRLFEEALKGIEEAKRPEYGFILGLDNDEPGKQATIEAQAILDKLGFKYTTKSALGTFKDANERLVGDRDGLKNDLLALVKGFSDLSNKEKNADEKAKADYLAQNSAQNALEGLISEINAPTDKYPLRTNFKALDGVLGGEINKGIITIGALSSLGKTSLVLQIADQIAQEGKRDILYFTLEMSKKELVAKSLSRLTYLDAFMQGKTDKLARTTAGIMNPRKYAGYDAEQQGAISRAFDAYRRFANRLFFIEPSDSGSMNALEIEKRIMEHIRVTKGKPLVIIDYLQIMKPIHERETERQALDENFSALKRVSAREGLTIILISSVSRANYNAPIDMASFKDSGGIEYSSDYLLGLDLSMFYDGSLEGIKDPDKNFSKVREVIREAKKANPRKVVLTILKNRNGEIDKQVSFNYYPAFNTFVETDSQGEEDRGQLNAIQQTTQDDKTDNDLPF
jgi:replicative DNA helicase